MAIHKLNWLSSTSWIKLGTSSKLSKQTLPDSFLNFLTNFEAEKLLSINDLSHGDLFAIFGYCSLEKRHSMHDCTYLNGSKDCNYNSSKRRFVEQSKALSYETNATQICIGDSNLTTTRKANFSDALSPFTKDARFQNPRKVF